MATPDYVFRWTTLPLPDPYSVVIANELTQVEGKRMIDYTTGTIARLEYEEKLQSRAPILDCDVWIRDDQPSPMSLQIGRWVRAMQIGLAAVSERLKHKPVAAPDSPRTCQEQSGMLS